MAQANQRGFGSIVLLRATPQALGGSAEINRGPGHVRWQLTAPVDSITEVRDNEEEPALSHQVFDPIRHARSPSLHKSMIRPSHSGTVEVPTETVIANGAK